MWKKWNQIKKRIKHPFHAIGYKRLKAKTKQKDGSKNNKQKTKYLI